MLMKEDKQALFEQMDKHLQQDEKPSVFFEMLLQEGRLNQPPFSMLAKLKQTHQSPTHHPEGDVWNHTMLVIDNAAQRKRQSSHPHAFMWAALLHDIGKPKTTRMRKGRITSYDHDKVGQQEAQEFLKDFVEDSFAQSVAALVRWHMQILFVVKNMPFADIAAMKQQVQLSDVALLGLCDRLGRLNPNEAAEQENIKLFVQKCRAEGMR